ncbi:hypothetical protein P4S52_20560 [Vibrio sp. SA48]|nr:hypothetical protein ACS86_17510 [Vibrio alginolyticus]
MKNIKIIKGDFSGETWSLEKDRIEIGFYKVRQIPLSEVVELNKLEVTKKEHFVEFSLADGKKFTSSMSKKTYESCYKSFIESGNQPKNMSLPVHGKSRSNVIWSGLGVLFLIGLFGGGEPEKELMTSEKATLCKAYIGEIFNQPTARIDNYKNSEGLVYVRYIRASDNTAWSYVCDVSEGSMLWAAWILDSQSWGRWRYEDEVKLKYNETSKKMAFTMVDTGNRVEVQL